MMQKSLLCVVIFSWFCGGLTIHSCFGNSFTKQSKLMCQNSQQKFGLFQHEMPVRLIKLWWRSLSDSFHRARKFSSTSKFSPRKLNFLEHERLLETNYIEAPTNTRRIEFSTIEYRSCNPSNLDMDALFIGNIKENFSDRRTDQHGFSRNSSGGAHTESHERSSSQQVRVGRENEAEFTWLQNQFHFFFLLLSCEQEKNRKNLSVVLRFSSCSLLKILLSKAAKINFVGVVSARFHPSRPFPFARSR